jgi:hypothetical protein
MTDSADWPPLQPDEILLTARDELLWRQVNPQFANNGQVTSQAFRPNSEDGNLVSTSRESKQNAEGAFQFHTTTLDLESAGTWCVSVGEVMAADARAIDDSESASAPPPPCPPGHTSIDMRPFGKSMCRKIGSKLSENANVRGRQYP